MANNTVFEEVSLEKLNRFHLMRHNLLTKAGKDQLERVISDICGLHSQLAMTPTLSLWNRVESFERNLLEEALYIKKSLVKVWCMRGTLHIIPSDELLVYHQAVKRMWFEHHGRYMRGPDWPPLDIRKGVIYPKILEALKEGPLTRTELNTKISAVLEPSLQRYKRLFSAWGGILKEMCYLGLIVYAEPNRETRFARLDQWLPQISLEQITEKEARTKLLLKYLHGYGPASVQDFAYWSGITVSESRKVFTNTEQSLKEIKVEGMKKKLWLLKDDFNRLEGMDVNEKPLVHLLPKFDPLLLGHKDKSHVLKSEYLKEVFRPVGDIAATVLVDGYIKGTWNYKKTKNRLTVNVSPFEKLEKDNLEKIRRETEALGEFMEVSQVKLLVTS